MSVFTDREREYLGERRLGRIATVGKDGTPHVVPVGWSYNAEAESIDVGGMQFDRTKKFKDVRRSGRAAIVIDDLVSTDPWVPRGIEVRGLAEAIEGERPVVRIHPERIVSWGIESEEVGARHSRSVEPAQA
jgi:pyridoxamine 5'-phosphate oxidase family protein